MATIVSGLRIVVFTQGGLGVEISRRVAQLPGVSLAGISFERPLQPRRPFKERVQRHVKYYGYSGTVMRAANAVLRYARPNENIERPDDSLALNAIAAEHAAVFAVTSDLHAPAILESIRSVRPDLGLVIGTTIVKPRLFDLPRLGSLNLHQGKVPEDRGSACAFWALFHNESEYGVTVHRVVERVDAGDVAASGMVPFVYDFTKYGLDYERFLRDFQESLGPLSIELMVAAVRQIAAGTCVFARQDEAQAVRCRMPTYTQKKELLLKIKQRFLGLTAGARRACADALPVHDRIV